MSRKQIRFGLIGLGLMGREFASAVARWCHLLDDSPVPVVAGICARTESTWEWYRQNFPTIAIATADYRELIRSDEIDAVYCAVPHALHAQFYVDILEAGKHLLGEKPFGIDKAANARILDAVDRRPEQVVRCVSQLPYFPGAVRLVNWIRDKRYGRLMEVRAGFLHSSDMDLQKPINWKRMVVINGEYGCMGDLGLHILYIPLRMGWTPKTVYAHLQNIAETRPDKDGNTVPCETWDNATLLCECEDRDNGKPFLMTLETKRMAPGHTNTWFLEVIGTEGAAKFSTHDPRAFYTLEVRGREQGWTRTDIGATSFIPSIAGSIFEFGFSDALQQMLGAFMQEFREGGSQHPFPNATPQETRLCHAVLTAALESHRSGRKEVACR